MSDDLIEARKEHAVFVFDVLRWLLNGKKGPKPNADFGKVQYAPLFVTFKRQREDGTWKLRGCKGTFDDYELKDGLEQFAEISAFHDRRFASIELSEMEKLRVAVSFLSKFEKMGNKLRDWEIGVHGVKIYFNHPSLKTKMHATFLPHVAKEHGYDQDMALRRLYKKAGFRGDVTESLLQSTRLNRYQSSKFILTYQEYKKLRNL